MDVSKVKVPRIRPVQGGFIECYPGAPYRITLSGLTKYKLRLPSRISLPWPMATRSHPVFTRLSPHLTLRRITLIG